MPFDIFESDVLLPNWVGGRDAALDVTVINPCQDETVVKAVTTPLPNK